MAIISQTCSASLWVFAVLLLMLKDASMSLNIIQDPCQSSWRQKPRNHWATQLNLAKQSGSVDIGFSPVFGINAQLQGLKSLGLCIGLAGEK